MPKITQRQIDCIMCGNSVTFESSTTPAPEAPEMLRAPPKIWFGLIGDDRSATEIIIVCSEDCLSKLLSE
jgi:hypothetical protein